MRGLAVSSRGAGKGGAQQEGPGGGQGMLGLGARLRERGSRGRCLGTETPWSHQRWLPYEETSVTLGKLVLGSSLSKEQVLAFGVSRGLALVHLCPDLYPAGLPATQGTSFGSASGPWHRPSSAQQVFLPDSPTAHTDALCQAAQHPPAPPGSLPPSAVVPRRLSRLLQPPAHSRGSARVCGVNG